VAAKPAPPAAGVIHRDEAMAECLAAKQPLGEYRSDSLAAEEILTLANWCLLHFAARAEHAGSSV
jgi:cellulose biosynthesis protein BcsQ